MTAGTEWARCPGCQHPIAHHDEDGCRHIPAPRPGRPAAEPRRCACRRGYIGLRPASHNKAVRALQRRALNATAAAITHVYPCEVASVVDGDTVDLVIDVGFHFTTLARVRLFGADCPEVRGRTAWEREHARRATELARAWLAERAGTLTVQTEPDPDNFGRWLGVIAAPDGSHLAGALLDAGLAVVWPERWIDVYTAPEVVAP